MSTTLRFQVTIPNQNGVPADAMTNTWHFASTAVDPMDDATQAADDLIAFYLAIDGLLASTVDTIFTYKIYDLTAAEPRVPILSDNFNVTPGANSPLPSEVCCVLSYRGTPSSGIAQGRRRGRIFLGPLDSADMDNSAGQSLIDTGVITTIATAAENLMDAGDAVTAKWSVFPQPQGLRHGHLANC